MKTIHKYNLDVIDEQTIMMPEQSDFLSVGMQNEELKLWAVVGSTANTHPVKILIRGNGHYMNGKEGRFLGTVQQFDGKLVWHVFLSNEP